MQEIPPTPGRQGVIGVVSRNNQLLLIRRSAHVVAPRCFCFPGGGIHDGETEEQALVREFQEELAVDVRPLRKIWETTTPWQVHLHWWTAKIVVDSPPVPNPREVESVHWFTLDEMASLPDSLPSNFEFIEAIESGRIDLTIDDSAD